MPILIKLLPAVNISYEDSGFHNTVNAVHDSLVIYEDKTKHQQQQQNNPPACKGWLVVLVCWFLYFTKESGCLTLSQCETPHDQ